MSKILIVEDNDLNFLLANDILTAHHYEVQRAVDCDSFLRKLETYSPNLILMDIGLPGFSGIDCYKLLRQRSQFDQVPVYALTASVMPDQIKQILEAGFNGVIDKPIRLNPFIAKIQEILQS